MPTYCVESMPDLSILIAFGAGLLCANMIPQFWHWMRQGSPTKDGLAR